MGLNELLLVVSLLAGPGDAALVKAKLDVATKGAVKRGPWTITSVTPPAQGIAKNDYYSEAPYWWPDPANPTGPFIRKDGQTYPQRFDKHRRMLGDVCQNLLALGLRASYLKDGEAARKGGEVARVWFLDPATRMNPHLDYGQAIRGRNGGRGAGIIDTRGFIWAVEGLRHLEAAGAFTEPEKKALRAWMAAYVHWLMTSKNGMDEGKAKNNHGTWWSAQVLALSQYGGGRAERDSVYKQVRERMIPGQIRASGACPEEEARTRSLGYSAMNMDAWTVLATYAGRDGVNLWEYRAKGSGSIRDGVNYLRPFLAEPASWKKPQITPFEPEKTMFRELDAAARGEGLAAIVR